MVIPEREKCLLKGVCKCAEAGPHLGLRRHFHTLTPRPCERCGHRIHKHTVAQQAASRPVTNSHTAMCPFLLFSSFHIQTGLTTDGKESVHGDSVSLVHRILVYLLVAGISRPDDTQYADSGLSAATTPKMRATVVAAHTDRLTQPLAQTRPSTAMGGLVFKV